MNRLHESSQDLLIALYRFDYELAKDIIQNNPELINYRYDSGSSTINIVLRYDRLENNYDLTRFLLDNGANPNTIDKMGMTPLIYAAELREPDTIKMLLSYGADPNLKGKYRISPLYASSECGCLECCKILVQHGAIIDQDL
jgi:ankyrin repeat protein